MTLNIELGGFTFISDFDSGNLGRVELVAKKSNADTSEAEKSSPDEEVPDFEFNLWTQPDCAGTEYENGNRTWFYFGIKGGTPSANMQLNIVDLNKQMKMYSQGMAPVCRIVPGKHHWERIKDKPQFRVVNNVFILTFKYRTPENPRATVYFAFTYPYPYFEMQNTLHNFDNRLKSQDDSRKRNIDLDDIYYHRECVCYSLEGRRVDLITISSYHHITDEREPRLKYLFPETGQVRPFRFNQKKVVFVSARVHPGETPSSFVIAGLLKLLLQRDDPIAVLLRKNFVFKLIPMLNPDGVFNGHYRTDTRGVNLNRVYSSPSHVLHPAIYAARSLILYHHHGQEIDDVVTGPIFDPASRMLKSRVAPAVTESDSAEFSDVLVSNPDQLRVNSKNILDSIEENVQDMDNTSSVEKKVSSLTLEEKGNSLPDATEPDTTCPQVDVLSAICEAVIRKVLDIKDSEPNISPPLGEYERTKSVDRGKGMSGVEDLKEKLQKLTQGETLTAERESFSNQPTISPNAQGLNSTPIIGTSEYSQTEREEETMFAQRSETSLSVGSLESSDCNAGFVKNNFINEVASCENLRNEDKEKKKIYTAPENSGLFLYLDLHGHASKKGIFMYGNHFENMNDSVECMLLPKIMSINNANFHFSACNFTERNMYLRDRKDGSSREGCGRVSVLKATGLIRSYTLECNYNTGRIVNVVPQCVRDIHKPNPTLLVPPKYTPHVFEEIGQALGASMLDLTGTHPWSRIPNSEFRTLNGIREWLKANCIPEQMYIHKNSQDSKHPNSQRQVVCLTGATVRMSRPARAAANAANGCKTSRHDTKRRLAPLSKAAKAAACASISAFECAGKSEDEGSSSAIDFDRKENVTSFQIISPPQSPKHMKLNKNTSSPKENVSPSSSQKVTNTPKKLKAVNGMGVLKQVLGVRAKGTSINAGSGSPKARSTTRLKVTKASLNGSSRHKNHRASYNQCVKCVTSDTQMSSDRTQIEGCKSTGTQAVIDQSGDSSSTQLLERKNSGEKIKYVKEESKGLVKHGPKRLKVSCGRPDQQSVASQKGGSSKLSLKEICYLNLRKQKKKFSKLAMFTETVVENPSSSTDKSWNSEYNPRVVPLKATRQNSLHSKNKLVHRNLLSNASVSKNPVSNPKSMKTSNPSSSSNVKIKTNNKSDKHLKNKVPHLSPIKSIKISPSLGRKVSVDAGKKWGKASLKSLASSFSKLRTLSGDIVYIEMKRKKPKKKGSSQNPQLFYRLYRGTRSAVQIEEVFV